MPHYRILSLLLVVLALALAETPAAHAADAEPADYLPSGTAIRQTVRGDIDGDGREDQVVLYSVQNSATAPARASLLILVAADDGVRPVHLFGAPPQNLRGEPTLDPNGSTDLTLNDLNADGRPELLMSVTVQYQEPKPRTMLWVFGKDDPTASPADELSAGPWTGTGFQLQAFLEGYSVAVLPPDPANPDRTSTLHREAQERRFGGPDPMGTVSETYAWRGGGFRLAMRSINLPAESGTMARSPETAVLAFYDLQARGEFQASLDLLSDELRASRSATLPADPATSSQQLRVEELREIDQGYSQRPRTGSDRQVYVRVSMPDPRFDPPLPGAAGDQNAASAASQPPRHTISGTWTTQQVGDQWRLVAATLAESPNLDAISATLPAGVNVVQTADGDLQGQGFRDVAVLVSRPGRFTLMEPFAVLSGPNGPERSVPLASAVGDEFVGAVGGTIRAGDVNGDGRAEVTFSGFVGAHSALLWVLRWDGAHFVPLFAEGSNSPVIDLADLDGDGIPEIVLGQSGYCGSYAASPHFNFAFRWEDGAYRSASMRYPTIHDSIDERAVEVAASGAGDGRDDARACVQHMLAMANAFRGRPTETRTAYQAYAQLRQGAAQQGSSVRPIYLSAPYVEADLRAVLAAAESGQRPDWSASDRAILHDLLGDALIERARGYQFEADSHDRTGKRDDAREARRKGSEARQAATREYQAALDLDPNDAEARRAIGE